MNKEIRGYIDEILYILKGFKVPSTNNNAETSQRGAKIKQKIGKFRSLEGATIYVVIKSCISTYQKNGINLYKAIMALLNNEPILI